MKKVEKVAGLAAPGHRAPRKGTAAQATERSTSLPGKPARRRLDWERIERDHATGRYTDAELAAKYETHRQTISERRTRDRAANPSAWSVDRSDAVKRATAALLIQAQTNSVIAAGDGATAVMAAATNARDVILTHRTEIREGRRIAGDLLAELAATTTRRDALVRMLDSAAATMDEAEAAALAAQARELVKLHNRVGSMQKLADTMTRLQTLERKAFGIGDDDAGTNPLDTMNEGELQAEIDRLAAKLAG